MEDIQAERNKEDRSLFQWMVKAIHLGQGYSSHRGQTDEV